MTLTPDDRLPVLLVILDGLGDRAHPALAGRTPAEAAATPTLDELARRGVSGLHVPFGWGRAPSSEVAHWALFGYGDIPFCGRAVLEALGAGVPTPEGLPLFYAALRSSEAADGVVWVRGRAGASDADDTNALFAAIAPHTVNGVCFALHPLRGGEAILSLAGAVTGDVTDTEPFFPDRHPWLRPLPLEGSPEAVPVAEALAAFLRQARTELVAHPVNTKRQARGLPPLDLLTTKWGGCRRPLPCFSAHVGCAGAAVTDSGLYRGLAELLEMDYIQADPLPDLEDDMARRLDLAEKLFGAGAAFVHVHTKAPDEAGHSKRPLAKRDVLEAIDRGVAALPALAERVVVAVTGDHATPSVGGVLHTGDPSPLVVAGPTVRPDTVVAFGEGPASEGVLGILRAADILPLLLGSANRARFLGHRPHPHETLALPDHPLAFEVES